MTPYYQDDLITLYLADCREIIPIVGEIDLVLTDPPYEAHTHNSANRCGKFINGKYRYAEIDFDPINEELRALVTSIPCNWSLIFCQVEAVSKYKHLLGDAYVRTMIWTKPDGTPQFTGDRPAQGYECIATSWHGNDRMRWNGGGKRGVFNHKVRDGEQRFHPTQKPITLIRELIKLFSLGGVIFDPFAGSGTTLRAAKDLGIKAIGVEMQEKYCEAAVKRLAQESLFGGII